MADAFGDAFAQDIGGAWTANVPRQKGELVLFNLDLACEGGALSGRGHQLFNGQTWHFSISAGTLQEDRVSLTLDFGSGDTEEWVGEVAGGGDAAEMRLSYSRKDWSSQHFVLKRGVGSAPPPSPVRPGPQPPPQRPQPQQRSVSSLCTIS